MVPKGWGEKPLIKLLDKIIDYRGQSVPKADNGIPLITARNVRFGYLDFSNQEYVDEGEFENWMSRGIPDVGDILFTTEAPLGMACRFPEKGRYAVAQRTVTLRTSNRLHSDFLLYFLLSEHGQRLIDIRSSGSTAKGIKSAELKKVKLLHPTCINEQQKIAKILSTWDKAISTTERLIDNSTQQKKALMQQLLTGKKRLLDDEGKRFEGEWEQVIFGEITKLSSKKYNPLKANKCLPCIELEHLDQSSGRIIGNANASELASIKNYFEAGSVLFGKLRPYLRKYARPDFEGVCSTEIWVFKTTSKLLDEYLLHFVQTDKFVSEANKSSGSKMPRADWGVVSELVIKIPSLKEQQKIATVLTNADKEIELLEQQLADLQQEKKALMQVLLTGKKRVVVD